MNKLTQKFGNLSNTVGFICVVLIVMSFSFPADIAAADACPLFPVPKQWTDRNTTWTISPAQTVIAISKSATEQQKYAAERLQTHIKNRFENRMIQLVDEGNLQAVQQAMDEIRPNVEQQLTLILAELQGLKGITEYV